MVEKKQIKKAWAVIFPERMDIYEHLIETIGGVRRTKAIFPDKKDAEWWIRKFGNDEYPKPKVVKVEINLCQKKQKLH